MLRKILSATVLGFFFTPICSPLSAATYGYHVAAYQHVWANGTGYSSFKPTGLFTGLHLNSGQHFNVSVDDIKDTWNTCIYNNDPALCEVNADGERLNGLIHQIYSHSGASFASSSLVGRVGSGDFFAVGTTGFNGPSDASGELQLFNWDYNTNNGGSIAVTVVISAVPLPAAGFLLAGALGGLGLMRRRKKS